MTSPTNTLLARFATLQEESDRRLSHADCEKLGHDLRTGIRAIGIYADLMQRDIDADPDNVEMQQYCDGINATLKDLTNGLEQLQSYIRLNS